MCVAQEKRVTLSSHPVWVGLRVRVYVVEVASVGVGESVDSVRQHSEIGCGDVPSVRVCAVVQVSHSRPCVVEEVSDGRFEDASGYFAGETGFVPASEFGCGLRRLLCRETGQQVLEHRSNLSRESRDSRNASRFTASETSHASQGGAFFFLTKKQQKSLKKTEKKSSSEGGRLPERTLTSGYNALANREAKEPCRSGAS